MLGFLGRQFTSERQLFRALGVQPDGTVRIAVCPVGLGQAPLQLGDGDVAEHRDVSVGRGFAVLPGQVAELVADAFLQIAGCLICLKLLTAEQQPFC